MDQRRQALEQQIGLSSSWTKEEEDEQTEDEAPSPTKLSPMWKSSPK